MKKFLLLALPIMVMCAVSCEKEEQIKKGAIDAIITYSGELIDEYVYDGSIYICSMNQLDLITTFIQQIHETYMDGAFETANNLSFDFFNSMYVIYGSGSTNSLFYNMDPGSYIVVASKVVLYNYNGFPMEGTKYQYKVVNVESDQVTSVAFAFEDYFIDNE